MNATPAGALGVLVVAKAPQPGRVKTRLTPVATAAEAADIAAAALLDTLDAVHATGAAVLVALAGDLDRCVRGKEIRSRLARGVVLFQRGHSFGDRLANAHLDARRVHAYGPILQIGSDTPQVSPGLLLGAAEQLRDRGVDGVLGPAADGGWWALGLRDAKHADVLRTVPMSRADTGAQTLAALRTSGLRIGSLPELRDVDTVADAVTVAAEIPGSRFADAVSALRDRARHRGRTVAR
ncbi:MAG: TIGR04282 family arsenosugar biosynthesis glycosyltransferase [Actinopolymorphaceae bacterium]